MDPSQLVQYGALGVLALSAVSVAAALWRRLSSQQDAHTKELKEINAAHAKQLEELGKVHATRIEALSGAYTTRLEALSEGHAERLEGLVTEHKAEMKLLMEQLLATHSNQMREYHKLSENMVTVLDSMTRKFERPPGRGRLGGG